MNHNNCQPSKMGEFPSASRVSNGFLELTPPRTPDDVRVGNYIHVMSGHQGSYFAGPNMQHQNAPFQRAGLSGNHAHVVYYHNAHLFIGYGNAFATPDAVAHAPGIKDFNVFNHRAQFQQPHSPASGAVQRAERPLSKTAQKRKERLDNPTRNKDGSIRKKWSTQKERKRYESVKRNLKEKRVMGTNAEPIFSVNDPALDVNSLFEEEPGLLAIRVAVDAEEGKEHHGQ